MEADRELSEAERSTLKGLMDTWAQQASETLSQLTSKEIEISLSKIGLYPIEKIPSNIGNPRDTVLAVYLKLDGEKENNVFRTSSLLFMYSPEGGIELASVLQGMDVKERPSQELNEMDESALKETGNILAGTCATILSDFFGFKLIEDLPLLAFDMMQAVVDNILVQFALDAEDALIFDIAFRIKGKEISSNFLILFDPVVRDMLLSKIGDSGQKV